MSAYGRRTRLDRPTRLVSPICQKTKVKRPQKTHADPAAFGRKSTGADDRISKRFGPVLGSCTPRPRPRVLRDVHVHTHIKDTSKSSPTVERIVFLRLAASGVCGVLSSFSHLDAAYFRVLCGGIVSIGGSGKGVRSDAFPGGRRTGHKLPLTLRDSKQQPCFRRILSLDGGGVYSNMDFNYPSTDSSIRTPAAPTLFLLSNAARSAS